MGDPRLLELLDQIGASMKLCASYKEELRLQGIKPQKVPYISAEPVYQPQNELRAEVGLVPARWELIKWRKRCPSGWFTEDELDRALEGTEPVHRVIHYLKVNGAIRYSPTTKRYRKAFLV